MIALEKRAIEALAKCRMGFHACSERFRGDVLYNMRVNAEYKLTAKQALFLWSLVHTFRAQIGDKELLKLADERHRTGKLPDIYFSGDHRPAVAPGFKEEKVHREKKRAVTKAELPAAINSSQRSLFEEESRGSM